MEFLGVGAAEALVVFVLILILVGPQRFPEMMRQGGRWYRIARGFTSEVMKDVRAAVDEIEQDVKDDPDLLSVRDLGSFGSDLERDLDETRRDLDRTGTDAAAAAGGTASRAPRPISSARSASGAATPRQPSRLLNQLRERGSDSEASAEASPSDTTPPAPRPTPAPRPASPRAAAPKSAPRPAAKDATAAAPRITLPEDDPFKALEARRAAASGQPPSFNAETEEKANQ